jgi:hypothetical protein
MRSVIDFGPFSLDSGTGALRRDGMSLPIGQRAAALLRILIEQRNEAVSKDDLLQAAWPAQAVAESNLSGSFFDHAPAGADIYMLIRVLHDWSDDDCLRILRVCRTAMDANSTLLIGEQLLEPDPVRGNPLGYLADTHMMAMFGPARERTAAEFRGLLETSGFSLRRIVPTASLVSIIEGAPW